MSDLPLKIRDELSQRVGFALPPYVAPLLLLAALLLWGLSLTQINLQQMNDLGLISVLPWTFFAGILLSWVSFVLAVWTRRSRALLLLFLVVLIVMLFGTTSIVEPYPRTAIVWKLMGIMDYVSDEGAVNPRLDAFHNWPGFFITLAYVTEAFDLPNALPLARMAPVFFNLLYLGPLYLLLGDRRQDSRLLWLALGFFYLGNWVGQDYLAPQAWGFTVYLLIIAILLRWFRQVPAESAETSRWITLPRRLRERLPSLEPWLNSEERTLHQSSGRQRMLLMATVIFMFAVIVPSHQLTPVVIIASVTGLVLLQRITPRALPLLMIVLLGVWLSYMTVPYLSGHIHGLIDPLGDISANVDDNINDRLRGSLEHLFVVRLRIVFTLLLWAGAFLGFWRSQRRGFRDVDFALLWMGPFTLLALQTYGGELLLRAFLFSLPFTAFFLASLFLPRPESGRGWRAPLLAILTGIVLAGGFFVARYGNERMDYFSGAEYNAVRAMYDRAPEGAVLVSVTDFLPWRYDEYGGYRYRRADNLFYDGDFDSLQALADGYGESYLIVTRSQIASTELFLGWPEGLVETRVEGLRADPDFDVIYENQDAILFTFAPTQEGDG